MRKTIQKTHKVLNILSLMPFSPERFRQLRNEQGYNLQAFARELCSYARRELGLEAKIQRQNIQQWEHGGKIPSGKNREVLLHYLIEHGYDPLYLYVGRERRTLP